MSTGVTLASLLGGHISVEWYEGVALVREVADRLLDDSGQPAKVPELNQIYLSPEGHVDLAGGKSTDEPVRRLGQLLLALIANSDAPVQLRLVISQATAPVPAYRSIREYSDALAFFERPERSNILYALATRAGNASTPASERPPTLDSLAPLPKAQDPKDAPKTRESRRSRAQGWSMATIAVALILTIAGGSWYAWKRGIGPRNQADATVLADQTADKVGTALIAGASAVTERLGLGRIVPADAAPSPAPEPAVAPSTANPSPRKPANASPPNPVPTVVAYDLEVPEKGDTSPVAVPPTIPAGDPAEMAPPDDPTIYTIGSEGITAPVGLRIQLARQLPADLDRQRLARVDLVIAVDGTVESAKLVGPPRTVQDGLFLSVAKAWSFQPALKDGVPVRYRKTIWIASP